MRKLLLLLPILALAWCSETPVVVDEPQVIESVIQQEPIWIEVCAYFTDEFIEKYQYEDSKWYMFALKIDWNYYNVFRNEKGWVSNSKKHWLDWAIPAYLFKQPYCWRIPFGEIKVARKDDYWFEYKTLEYKYSDIDNRDNWYILEISPVKEWVETHTIWYDFYY